MKHNEVIKVCVNCYDKNRDYIIAESASGKCERERRGCRVSADKVVASNKPYEPEL